MVKKFWHELKALDRHLRYAEHADLGLKSHEWPAYIELERFDENAGKTESLSFCRLDLVRSRDTDTVVSAKYKCVEVSPDLTIFLFKK